MLMLQAGSTALTYGTTVSTFTRHKGRVEVEQLLRSRGAKDPRDGFYFGATTSEEL
jgi:hypothetical protein